MQPAPKAAAAAQSSDMNTPAGGVVTENVQPRRQNLLHLSNQRTRRFYERAAREIFASGFEEIELSALKSAVPLAITVALSLQDKKAGKLVKINTQYVTVNASQNRNYSYSSSGVTIILKRHPEFKGTRIVPNYIFFCPKLTDSNVLAYPETPENVFGLFTSVLAGRSDSWFSAEYGAALTSVLKKADQDYGEMHKKLQAYMFKEALNVNKDAQDLKSIKFIGELAGIKTYQANLKAAFVRLIPKATESDMTGTVFIDVFEDKNCPHNNPVNGALTYLVAPRESSYKTTSEFLAAVELAASNVMAALCDFNGYCRRGSTQSARLKRIAVARLSLFSCDAKTSATMKAEVAEAIIQGLNKAYHFGIAPKLQFLDLDNDDVMKKAWIKQTGTETVRVTEGNFGRRASVEEQD